MSYAPFVTGWLRDDDAWGRPNDVIQTTTGDLLVSDDKANIVFRISYEGADPAVAEKTAAPSRAGT